LSYEAKRTEVEEVLTYANGDDFYKAEDELRELEEQLDEDTFNILHQFNDRKEVIISLCSC
jgi:tRNA(Phe) wybutosine-synthesizing methylase Tyw3